MWCYLNILIILRNNYIYLFSIIRLIHNFYLVSVQIIQVIQIHKGIYKAFFFLFFNIDGKKMKNTMYSFIFLKSATFSYFILKFCQLLFFFIDLFNNGYASIDLVKWLCFHSLLPENKLHDIFLTRN